jgi:hypothetical protein
MKMDKKSLSAVIIYGIILFVYIVAFFAIPFPKFSVAWISFLFTLIAIAGSLFVTALAFKSKETVISKVYGFPIFRVGAIYAAVQLVLGLVFSVVGLLVPAWIPLVIYVVLLGAAAIGVIITDNTRDMIEQLDEELKVDIKNVTYFQVDIAGIVDACENDEVKPELAELNDLFTYSDPVSNDETRPLEDEIKELLKELRGIIDEGSTEDIKKLIKKIKLALNERNRVCKVSK